MYHKELDDWADQQEASDRVTQSSASQTERRERVAMLLRHSEGASIEQLMYLTKSDAADVRRSIREIIDAGLDIEVRTKPEDNTPFFLLFD